MNGNPLLLVSGWDSDGNGCGISEGFADYKYLYWPTYPSKDLVKKVAAGDKEAITSLLKNGVCVSACPVNDDKPVDCKITKALKEGEMYWDNSDKPTCTSWMTKDDLASFDINVQEYLSASLSVGGERVPFRYNTVPAGGFCVPNPDESLG